MELQTIFIFVSILSLVSGRQLLKINEPLGKVIEANKSPLPSHLSYPEVELVESNIQGDSNNSILLFRPGSLNDITYYLYTKQNPTTPVRIVIGDSSALEASGFIPNAPVKLLTHGWRASYQNALFPQGMKNAYLKYSTEDINVITTDWAPLSQNPDYFESAYHVPLVAKSNFLLIDFLLKSNVMRMSDLHLVGHSLGAHISGITGQNTQKGLNLTIPRISGLDPAKPIFGLRTQEHRIDSSDGAFVDIVHTTGNLAGIYPTLGDADFYPNGGIVQRGCELNPGCGHSRAHEYFTESISNPKAFKACPCPRPDLLPPGMEYAPTLLNCACSDDDADVHMGQFVSDTTSGVFCLQTNPSSPYSKST